MKRNPVFLAFVIAAVIFVGYLCRPPTALSQGGWIYQNILNASGHIVTVAKTANTPTVGACGGTASTITGTDNAFNITFGSGSAGTKCGAVFGTVWSSAPICTGQNTADISATALAVSATSVVLTESGNITPLSTFNVVCTGTSQ